MGISNTEYFALFVTTFVLVGILTPLARKFALSKSIVDNPNQGHKTHREPIPYLGGVAIMFGVVAVSYGTSLVSNFTLDTFYLASSVLVPALILGIIGLWDDIRNLSPNTRFLPSSLICS